MTRAQLELLAWNPRTSFIRWAARRVLNARRPDSLRIAALEEVARAAKQLHWTWRHGSRAEEVAASGRLSEALGALEKVEKETKDV